jgi:hypothetical protein
VGCEEPEIFRSFLILHRFLDEGGHRRGAAREVFLEGGVEPRGSEIAGGKSEERV